MPRWKDFEEAATEYLNDYFDDVAEFILEGGENSNVADIKVECYNGDSFYIEAKATPAQCGQFVLIPDREKRIFVFSSKNNTKLIPSAQRIIDHMNENFDIYTEAGTTGVSIDLGDGGDTFAQWIVSSYRSKDVRFFITNDFTILPIEDIQEHFYISAVYRVKRSGSSTVGRTRVESVMRYIESCGYFITDYSIEDDKLFVKSSQDLHNERFKFGNHYYMFSDRNGRFEIRKLSNTDNANVIFSIHKKPAQGLTGDEFISYLE